MRTVFFDVDTQLDFLLPAGALSVPGAQQILPALRTLTRFAATNRITIVSTADAHAEDDPEFRFWKPHCVAGTVGQAKESGTLLSSAVIVGRAHASLPALEAPQIVIEKQTLDVFANPNVAPLLDALRGDRFVVYGVVTELCVASAVNGLLARGARVELVNDAIRSLDARAGQALLESFRARGGILTTAAAITASLQM